MTSKADERRKNRLGGYETALRFHLLTILEGIDTQISEIQTLLRDEDARKRELEMRKTSLQSEKRALDKGIKESQLPADKLTLQGTLEASNRNRRQRLQEGEDLTKVLSNKSKELELTLESLLGSIRSVEEKLGYSPRLREKLAKFGKNRNKKALNTLHELEKEKVSQVGDERRRCVIIDYHLQDMYIMSLRSDIEAAESQLISLATEACNTKMYVTLLIYIHYFPLSPENLLVGGKVKKTTSNIQI